jgi:hypothetical protein
MKHPSEATLALYAGGDLGAFARWKTDRHVANCARCQAEAARFSAVSSELAALTEMPRVPWTRLAAEMTANIRLGLAAGEIVRNLRAEPHRISFHPRAVIATCCMATLLLAGVWLQRPAPRLTAAGRQGVTLEATGNGIAVRDGDQMMTLMNGRAASVMYTAGAQGVMRARYVDSETGQVTINNVYVE